MHISCGLVFCTSSLLVSDQCVPNNLSQLPKLPKSPKASPVFLRVSVFKYMLLNKLLVNLIYKLPAINQRLVLTIPGLASGSI